MADLKEKLIEILREDKAYPNCAECKTPAGHCNRCVLELHADHLIANGVTVQKWIPVTERLPEDMNERVLVTIKDANSIIGHPDMDTDRYRLGKWVRWGGFVTHWMPLPEPPKEVE